MIEMSLPTVQVGMKLEASDQMDPRLICVSTIARTVGRLLKVTLVVVLYLATLIFKIHSCLCTPEGSLRWLGGRLRPMDGLRDRRHLPRRVGRARRTQAGGAQANP